MKEGGGVYEYIRSIEPVVFGWYFSHWHCKSNRLDLSISIEITSKNK